MNEFLKGYILMLSACGVVCGVLLSLNPVKSGEKLVKFAIALFFLAAVIKPLTTLKSGRLFEINIQREQQESFTQIYNKELTAALKESFENNIRAALRNKDIDLYSIHAQMTADGALVNLESLELSVSDKERAKKVLIENLGLDGNKISFN